jgi:hypothetical protein
MTRPTPLFLFILLFLSLTNSFAQSAESPVEHMSYLSEREDQLSKYYLSYMSEVAHGERARKMEKRRMDLLNYIKETIKDANRLRPFKGDASLRNAYIAYWNILLSIFNEDYHKIVDMEEVAEQSYDLMEAYLLAQDKADQKLDEAYQKIPEAYNAFAASHNVRLTEAESTKLSRKLGEASAVNAYFKVIYLIFFKASVQEVYVLDALRKSDINGLEQNRGSMLKYAEEGLLKLDTIKPYKGDASLITATRKVLDFYKREADQDIPVQSDFLIKSDEFAKIKKSYDIKPAGKRTQADVDTYNKSVNDINSGVASYNKSIEASNKSRTVVINNWNASKKRFMDIHVPYK